MVFRVQELCRVTGQRMPDSIGEVARCVLDSLAQKFGATVRQAAELSGKARRRGALVGGGVHNELLCQLTADACGLPVVAGPVEATALGNVLVQARTTGVADRRPHRPPRPRRPHSPAAHLPTLTAGGRSRRRRKGAVQRSPD